MKEIFRGNENKNENKIETPILSASRLKEQGQKSLIKGNHVLYASQQLVVVLIRLIPFA